MHRPLKNELIVALKKVLSAEAPPADKVLEHLFRSQKKWGARDRRAVAEAYYEVIRWGLRLAAITGSQDPEAWLEHWLARGLEIPTGIELSESERDSFPKWLDHIGQDELGVERWRSVRSASNQVAPVDLRVNLLKAQPQNVIAALAKANITAEAIPKVSGALTLAERKNIFTHPAYLEGWFEVQDRASQLVAPFLDPQPGERVVDACSGSGGKTLHIAQLMQNKGSVLALDVVERKITALKLRARRAGANNIEARLIESSKTVKRLVGSADRLLLDVPCSGLGVLRRKPDAKWRLRPEQIAQVKVTQQEILERWHAVVKVGGTLVYSTCSILPSENEKQINVFLQQHPEFLRIEQFHILPDEGRGDGFFAAKLRKIK